MSAPIVQQLSADVCVAPQLDPAAIAWAAQAGFKSVINSRPDFEAGPGQFGREVVLDTRRIAKQPQQQVDQMDADVRNGSAEAQSVKHPLGPVVAQHIRFLRVHLRDLAKFTRFDDLLHGDERSPKTHRKEHRQFHLRRT